MADTPAQSPGPRARLPRCAPPRSACAARRRRRADHRQRRLAARRDFTTRFITHIASGTDGYELAEIDRAAAITALDAGHMPCSSGEQRMLRLAANSGGTPVSLQNALTGLDGTNIELLTAAIRQAAEQPPPTASFMID